jgi:hypothetical protein
VISETRGRRDKQRREKKGEEEERKRRERERGSRGREYLYYSHRSLIALLDLVLSNGNIKHHALADMQDSTRLARRLFGSINIQI